MTNRKAHTKANRVAKNYRFPQGMLAELKTESKRTRRSRTELLELSFAHFMIMKADDRDRTISRLS